MVWSSCTKKDQNSKAVLSEKAINENEIKPKSKRVEAANSVLFSKEIRESIYFANSIEREALRLIYKDNHLQKISYFSVLSYIVEVNSGAKKNPPSGLDCGKYEIEKTEHVYSFYKSCTKPKIEIARLKLGPNESQYEVHFLTSQWGVVVGMSVALTGSDVVCQIKINSKKLSKLSCQNWSYQTSEDQISSTLIKTKTFEFQRESNNQFVIKGGFYKELVENKKINITIPLAGKIKIIEKEIEVKDDFIEKIKKIEETGKENEEKKQKENELTQTEAKQKPKETNEKQNEENEKEVGPEDDSSNSEKGEVIFEGEAKIPEAEPPPSENFNEKNSENQTVEPVENKQPESGEENDSSKPQNRVRGR